MSSAPGVDIGGGQLGQAFPDHPPNGLLGINGAETKTGGVVRIDPS